MKFNLDMPKRQRTLEEAMQELNSGVESFRMDKTPTRQDAIEKAAQATSMSPGDLSQLDLEPESALSKAGNMAAKFIEGMGAARLGATLTPQVGSVEYQAPRMAQSPDVMEDARRQILSRLASRGR